MGVCEEAATRDSGVSGAQVRDEQVETRHGEWQQGVQAWAVRMRAGGCGREEQHLGARVLPYMDDFLVLASDKVEALRARELATLASGGTRRNGNGSPRSWWNTSGSSPTRAKLPTEDNQAAVADAEPLRLQEPLADAAHETPVLLDLTDLKLGARYITSEANERNQLGQPSVRTARRGRTQAAGVKVRRHGAWWPPIGRGQMWFQQQAALADEAVIKPRCRDLFTPVGYYLQQAKQEAAATQQPKPEYGSKARRKGGLGDSSLADLAVKMQSAAPEDTTVSNYRPNEEAFMQFCVTEGRSWLPATEAFMQFCVTEGRSWFPATEAFMQFCVTEGRSWLPATEAFMQFCVTEGRSWLPATEAKAQQAGKQEEELAVRTWLPTRYVSVVHAPRLGLHPVGRAEAEMLSACTCMVFAFVYFGRLNTGVSMLWDHNRVAASFVWLHRFGGGIVSVVLHKE
ncbi:hypothetical protein CYMTET_21780 [Cymbomonas tetramitiformis]|uniref:Uncharacterized protein n=1 Tax=Cymbomonas tetramitiformis TaxID=36881 RepID=A0AAE0L2M9_9CHLO|nr:hypothetical protein CYMTET_21780 [Cymbomonas tetramitiformis]